MGPAVRILDIDDEKASDPSDEVEGVSLEQYARVAVELHRDPDLDPDAVAQAHGIPAGRFKAVSEEWGRRLSAGPEVVQRYNAAYQAAMKDAGIEAPDITLQQYADILRRSRSTPLEEVLPEFGLTLQTFALVSGRWGERMMSDTALAARLAELLA